MFVRATLALLNNIHYLESVSPKKASPQHLPLRNRRLRAPAKPPVDRRRLVTDPQLRQEVTAAVVRHLRANPPGEGSVDDVEAAFAAAIMRTVEMVTPP